MISRAPVGRWGDGDDFSAIAVYLASRHSSFHLGDAIVIDGESARSRSGDLFQR